ncbi:hypothetical protein LARV_01800 [Longilinea arvoryzae]|uniref:Uncharacterized protein n=1 Tax=Longilinea arvoryzae TaxID=360412 RepID=A0A0S7BIA6_9CHLR|nr:hypothetical protein [Longilinea arvoryzae]GAP14040.1 hypothetical protein LARV_01800 [Longilinea arvoryzae]
METGTSNPKNDLLWNVLTLAMVAAIVIVGILFLAVFVNPNSALNPFPPVTLPGVIIIPTETPGRPTFPPTWTATAAPVTATIAPPTAEVPAVSATPADGNAVAPTATKKPSSRGYSFSIQTDPASISSVLFRPEWGCDWMGLAGQVVDLKNSPATGIRVQVGGFLGENKVDLLSLTGTALQYGRAGYEFTLAEKPIASTGKLWVQLLDQSDLPLSDKIYFDTYDSCEQNLIIINFKQVR